MRARISFLFSCAFLLVIPACSGNVGRYSDTRSTDSIAEIKTRNMAPRTIVGAERDSVMRVWTR